MQSRKLVLSAVCLIVAGVIGYLVASRRQENLETEVIRTYKVSPERAEDLRNSLNRILARPGDREGTASAAQIFADGLVMVRAPIGDQPGIHHMIEEIEQSKPQPRERVRLDYYMVLAQPGSSNSESFSVVGPALASIEKLDGPSHFRMLEHVSSTSLSGGETISEGSMLKVFALSWFRQGALRVRLSFESWFGRLKTNTDVKPGELLVLGQNAQIPKEKTKEFGTGNVYYILKAEILK